MMAEREVETAKALCDRWRLEEDAAVAENARLQVSLLVDSVSWGIEGKGRAVVLRVGVIDATHSGE